MKLILIYLTLPIIISLSNNLPHFIFDGIESFHECSNNNEIISFAIYGSFTQKIDSINFIIADYLIEDIGLFKCYFSLNENTNNINRKYKILCSIRGLFPRKGYILKEPIVYGFDFKREDGESSWPKSPEKRTFLIGKCGSKIELEDEPLLLFSFWNSYSSPLNNIRKDVVDKALSDLPKRESVEEKDMCAAMVNEKLKYSLTQGESAYLVYKWLSENIDFDCYALNHGDIDHSELGTYNKGKGVCSGYSMIFETMCEYLGLETEYVVGYSKGSDFIPGEKLKQADHAWNSVKIDSSYYLVDTTWGAGGCVGDDYKKHFIDFYFCPDPERFIRSHLPVENKWKLVSDNITLEDFSNSLFLSSAFEQNGFKKIVPDYSIIKSEGISKIIIYHDSLNTNFAILTDLNYINEEGTYIEQNNSYFYNKYEGKIEISIITNYKGEYILKLFGGISTLNTCPFLATYKIICTKDSELPLGFPTIYKLYATSDMQLIEPLYTPLKKGNYVNFKVITKSFKNLYVSVSKKLYRKLDKDEDGTFTANSVYIFGNQVRLCTFRGGSYKAILEYTTINNPQMKEEPTFPESYLAPSNILYSPLINRLIIGKKYIFKIECDSVDDMVVVDGYNYFHLSKDGSVFYGEYIIVGSSGEIKLSKYDIASKEMTTFYLYKVS